MTLRKKRGMKKYMENIYIYIYREGGGKMERKKGANRNIRRRLVGLE